MARKLKAAREADVARGEFHEQSRTSFAEYATEWVERYQGRGRGFRESTRDNYRSDLKRYAIPWFGSTKRLAQITPRDIANFIAWLCDESAQAEARGETSSRYRPVAERPPSEATVRFLGGEHRQADPRLSRNGGRRGSAPPEPGARCADAASAGGGDLRARRDPRAESRAACRLPPRRSPKHRTLFRFLASTGLRVSEVAALQWCHLRLDGAKPHVRVRRQLYRGRLQPPKSRHGRRDVPLDHRMVVELRTLRGATSWPSDEDLAFANEAGGPIDKDNLRRRHLRPAAEEAGAPWAAFHTFRHTCASLLFERGASVVQVERWLGHHSAAFTLTTYVHWLDGDDLGEPLALDDEVGSEPARERAVAMADAA